MRLSTHIYSLSQRRLSYVLLLVGLVLVICLHTLTVIFGALLILGFLIVRTTKCTTELNSNTSYIVVTRNSLGITKPVIHKLDDYMFVSILSKRMSGVMVPAYQFSRETKYHYQEKFDLVLLDRTHRKKLVLKEYSNRDETLEALKLISQMLKLPVAKYAPKVSQETRNRRKR